MRLVYLIFRPLLVLAGIFSRLPAPASGAFARLLDAARTPFDVVNYRGSRLGARVIPASRMGPKFDRVIAALERSLEREPDSALRRAVRSPPRWGPFFAADMTPSAIYRAPPPPLRLPATSPAPT